MCIVTRPPVNVAVETLRWPALANPSVLVVSATAAGAIHVAAGREVVVTGIGKTAAAAATTEALLRRET